MKYEVPISNYMDYQGRLPGNPWTTCEGLFCPLVVAHQQVVA